MNIKYIIAKTLSILLHPCMVMSVFYILATGIRYHYEPYTLLASCIGMTTTLTAALGLMAVCKGLKWIESYALHKRSDRPAGYLCFAIPFIIWMYCPTYGNAFTTLFLRVMIPALYTILVVSIFWKMSAHLYFFGTATGIIYTLTLRHIFPIWCIYIIAGMVLLAGMLAAARLHLKAHTPAQVYAGFSVGWLQAAIVTALIL